MRFPVDEPYRINTKFSTSHKGLDIAPNPAGKKGVKIYAPENATVVNSAYKEALEGHYIILKGKSKYYYFGHFASRTVTTGSRVKEGQEIGIMGMTGKATGIHTHHEVRQNRNTPFGQIDPEKYYKANVKGDDDMYKGKTAKQHHEEAVRLHIARNKALAELKKSQAADAKHIRIAIARAAEIRKLRDQLTHTGDPTFNDEAVKKGVKQSIINFINKVK